MLIHKDGVSKIYGQWYEYTFKQGVNDATISFKVKPDEVPETGEMIVGNRLVKQDAGRNAED